MDLTTPPDDVIQQVQLLSGRIAYRRRELDRLDSYFDGEQVLQHIGIAVPPELRDFEVVVNLPRIAVVETERRQQLKGFQRSGGEAAIDPTLRELWEANNLDAQASLVHTDAKIYGQSYVSVSTDPGDPETPIVQAEPSKAMALDVDARGITRAALREYRDRSTSERYATLYLPNTTYWLKETGLGWRNVQEPDEHNLDRVPVVAFVNQPRTGQYARGRSEMADLMTMTDSIARLISNMSVASETLALPHRWAAGVSKNDFVDPDGKVLPTWAAYMTAMKATENPDAKFGSFTAANLDNFHNSVNAMMSWAAAVAGLPVRFMGQSSVNPATEGAIAADETRLIRNVERMNIRDGASWSWVMDLVERFRTGDWPARNSIRAIWQDPSTPTRAQLADAASKLRSQGILSREGVWDEMGWDEARKDRERAYFAAEAQEAADDPQMAQYLQLVSSGGVTGSQKVSDGTAAGDAAAAG